MDLVDDEEIEPPRELRLLGQRLAEQSHAEVALQPVDRDDEPRVARPRVRAHASRASQATEEVAVEDAELQPELVAQLLVPLELQRRRAHDDRGAGAVPEEQLLRHEAGLDRLAEPDVVGDQQVRARHPQGANERLELIVLDLDPAAERRLQRAVVGRRDRPPANRVEERVELLRAVVRPRDDLRQIGAPAHDRPGLHLPDDVELLAGARVVGDRT